MGGRRHFVATSPKAAEELDVNKAEAIKFFYGCPRTQFTMNSSWSWKNAPSIHGFQV
jgi:hypothetical protein